MDDDDEDSEEDFIVVPDSGDRVGEFKRIFGNCRQTVPTTNCVRCSLASLFALIVVLVSSDLPTTFQIP